MPLSPKLYTWLCGLFASLGSIIFGYDLGVIAGVLTAPGFVETMGSRYNDPNLKGLIASIFVLGCFFGMFPVAYMADTLGRRKTILTGGLIYIVGGALQTASPNMDMMLAGRFFAGFGSGIMSDLAPIYQAEIAHPSIRGRLTTLQQFMLGIGAFIASWVTYGCTAGLRGTEAEWRVPLGIQIIPAIPLVCFILFFPESPRWLAEKGRMDEAAQTLARLHAHGNISDPFVISQMDDVKNEILKAKEIGESSWTELFAVKSNFRRVCLGYILQFSVQMTGVSAIQYYSTTIFTTMGFTEERILLFQSVNSVIALIGEACCVLWVDHTGRRLPLIVGNIASGLSFVVGAILMARWPGTVDNDAAHYIFIITTWVFNFFFSSCIGPLSWAYPVEIYSTRTRAKATALTSSSSWLSNFFIAQVTPIAFSNIGWKYYLVFAICGHTNALFIWSFYPETSGRRLEEMDTLFESAPIFVPGSGYNKRINRHEAEERLRTGHFVAGELTGVEGRDEEGMAQLGADGKHEQSHIEKSEY
ncbi:general substrate transporter [Cylindrobasidium torrendii FP15055 ss-10]|uniref:General substrate transporter n=1 Tax=Cylindrobasidium torrendii FP15055 ss-10 TaxID=1314674 RepID=A0A0D7BU60_9AGAR|nr:general substrate transporter [Cylindrobasidium torrendii FP15055 ss-10]